MTSLAKAERLIDQAAADLPPSVAARHAYRAGMAGSTAGVANGCVQGNLAILPEKLASSFHRFCQLNPKPCPIIGMSDVGDPRIPLLGLDLDIRTDIPRYRVWRDGEVVEEPTDIMSYWRDDLVAFVLGCSFSFEEALLDEGLPIRHIEHKVRVPMFRTNIACSPSGPFAGPMVVSMRPFKPADAIRAVQITSRFPSVHGAPIHLGLPHSIGIADCFNGQRLPFFEALPQASSVSSITVDQGGFCNDDNSPQCIARSHCRRSPRADRKPRTNFRSGDRRHLSIFRSQRPAGR